MKNISLYIIFIFFFSGNLFAQSGYETDKGTGKLTDKPYKKIDHVKKSTAAKRYLSAGDLRFCLERKDNFKIIECVEKNTPN